MGAKYCSRNCCDSIMCDTYISQVGYICKDCIEEFKKYVISEQLVLNRNSKVIEELYKFIMTKKDESIDCSIVINLDEFFKEHTL